MKKIFYNKRHRLPIWSQVYIAWSVIFILGILWISIFGMVRNSHSLREAFDYKKEDIETGKYFNYVKNAFPNVQIYKSSQLENIRNDLPNQKWSLELFNYDIGRSKCQVVRYFPVNQKSSLVILFNHKPDNEIFQMLHGFALTLINNRFNDVSLVSVQGDYVCANNLINNKKLNMKDNAGIINLIAVNAIKSGIQTSISEKFSAIAWSMIIPEPESRPNIFQQMSHAIFPFFQRLLPNEKISSHRLINWYFPEGVYKNNTDTVHFILPSLLFTIKNYKAIENNFQSNSIWLGFDRALSKSSVLMLTILLVILTWLPVANGLYQNESINHIFMSFFSALFGSLLVIIILGLTKLISYFTQNSIWGPLILGIISATLFILFNRLHKTTFDLKAGRLAEFIVFNIFATIIGFLNLSLFIFLIPLIFILSKKQDFNRGLFKVLLVFSITPFIFAAYMLLITYGTMPALSLVWIQEVLYTHNAPTISGILLLGSLLTMVRDPS